MLFGWSKQGDIWLLGSMEMHTGFWWGNMRNGDYLEDPGLDGRVILNWILNKFNWREWTEFFWLRIETVDWLL